MKQTKKIWPLLILAVLLGVIISFRDISICLTLSNVYAYQDIRSVINITFFLTGYMTMLVFCLLWININWKGKGSNSGLIRFLISLCIVIVFFSLATMISHHADMEEYYRKFMFGHEHEPHKKIDFLALKSIIILFIVYIGAIIFRLYTNKIEAEKTLERLRAESLQSKLTALTNQVSPHFFFNALNALHSLIIEDKKESSLAYLSNLSNVFRYILRGEPMSPVTLKEELDFIEEYKCMLFIRYEKRLTFNMDIEDKYLSYKIPVMTLLPLIENVIKHNEISTANPMTITMEIEDNCLVITNPIKEKIDKAPSGGIGLVNLNNRYKLLMDKEIRVISNPDTYSVYVPLKGDTV